MKRLTLNIAASLFLLAGCDLDRIEERVAPEIEPPPVSQRPLETREDGSTKHEVLAYEVSLAGTSFELVDFGRIARAAPALTELPFEGTGVAINGGFFDPDFEAEGLVVIDGQERSAFSESLGGGIITIKDGRAAMSERPTRSDASFAIQGMPRLVVDGRSNIGRDTGRYAPRTALCVRDEGRTLDLIIAPAVARRGPSIFELAELLVRHGCEQALNLDGGPSTGVTMRGPGGSANLPPRAPIRQAIVFRRESSWQPSFSIVGAPTSRPNSE